MKMTINRVILWMKSGKIRTLTFHPNKVNVITGKSGTGKSVILQIIDYCFFASSASIPQEIVNENVDWYGLHISVNSKDFVLARGRLDDKGTVSQDFFFSSEGVIPEHPQANIPMNVLKKNIEAEFSVDQNVVIPYGGAKLKAGSRISLRYFMLFNTLSEDVITHSKVFFDKQDDDKYREALPRIFDLAIGIDTVPNILLRERANKIEAEISRLVRKQQAVERQNSVFDTEVRELVRRAKEHNLLDDSSSSLEDDIRRLKDVVNNARPENLSPELSDAEQTRSRIRALIRKLKKMKQFQKEYSEYRMLQDNNLDSLKPIEYIKKNYLDVIETENVRDFLVGLQNELKVIKEKNKGKAPFELNLEEKINTLEQELKTLQEKVSTYPQRTKNSAHEIDSLVLIGEVKARLSLYETDLPETDLAEEIASKELQLEGLQSQLQDYKERRELTVRVLEETIQQYIDKVSETESLGNYSGYKALFDYKSKSLRLRQKMSTEPSTVGSSSNYLFLHLCLFLGLHELIARKEVPFVAPLLILDQPSRPYYGKARESKDLANGDNVNWEDIENDDQKKITVAFQLLNDFVDHMVELGVGFQFIVFEHVPEDIWTTAGMKNVHLAREFENALIRSSDLAHQ